MTDVLLAGEAMGMFIAEDYGDFEDIEHFSKGIAGAEINVAIGLSRLGFDVSYVSKLGQEPFGYFIKNHLEKENIDTSHVIMDPIYRTGLQIKSKVKNDDPKVAYYRKGSAFSTLSKKDVEHIDFSKIKLFHMTGIPLALTPETREMVFYLAEKAREHECLVTFDPNLRPSLWEDEETMIEVLNKAAGYASIVMPGIEEGVILTGQTTAEEMADFYLEKGVEAVVIKDGSKGAYLKETEKSMQLVEGFKVEEVVDTVGAGDGFAAGVISALLDGQSIDEAVKRGNAIGSLQIQHKSDNEALPTRQELNTYMSGGSL